MKQVLIVGATSPVARETAYRFGTRGVEVALLGRQGDELCRIAADITLRTGAPARSVIADITDLPSASAVLQAVGPMDGLVWLAGSMEGLDTAFTDPEAIERLALTNFTAPAVWLTAAAPQLKARNGFIVGVSSVAGDRGRASNYPYGAAKAGFTALLDGMRLRLAAEGIRVSTVKPGFIDTRMTWALTKRPLCASPGQVADAIVRAADGPGCSCYVLPPWRLIMAILRLLPEPIFRKLPI